MSLTRQEQFMRCVGALFIVFFSAGPIVLMLATSVADAPDFLTRGSFSMTFHHYADVFRSRSLHFGASISNSLIVSTAAAFLAVAISSCAAYALSRLHVPGGRTLLFLVLAASSFPQISLVGYLFRMMNRFGILNTNLALILPYTAWALPLSLWILTSQFSRIPRELDEAAQIDGCTPFRTLISIILPLAAPGIVSAALLAFISCYNEFLFALLLTTDHRARTAPVALAAFEGLHGEIPWNGIMAASIITILPVIVLTFLFQRRIVQGLTRGGVKE